jgi:hypothetical protein
MSHWFLAKMVFVGGFAPFLELAQHRIESEQSSLYRFLKNKIMDPQTFLLYFYFFWWDWGLNSGLCTCKTGGPPFESHPPVQYFALVILKMEL